MKPSQMCNAKCIRGDKNSHKKSTSWKLYLHREEREGKVTVLVSSAAIKNTLGLNNRNFSSYNSEGWK